MSQPPPAGIVLMPGGKAQCCARHAHPLKIRAERRALMWEPRHGGEERRIETMGQHKRWFDERPTDFVDVADIGEFEITVEAKRLHGWKFRIVLIETIHLMQRGLDIQCTVLEHRCGAPERIVPLEHQHPPPCARIKGSCGKTSESGTSGTYNNRIKALGCCTSRRNSGSPHHLTMTDSM